MSGGLLPEYCLPPGFKKLSSEDQIEPFLCFFRWPTFGKICSLMLDAWEPLTTSELVTLEYQPTRASFQIIIVTVGG